MKPSLSSVGDKSSDYTNVSVFLNDKDSDFTFQIHSGFIKSATQLVLEGQWELFTAENSGFHMF